MSKPSGYTTRVILLDHLSNEPKSNLAWKQFDAQYREIIIRYALRCGLSMTDAEDVQQRSYLILLSVFPKFHYDPQKGRFRAYLASVVRRSIGQQRNSPSKHRAFSIGEFDPASETIDDPIWDKEWTLKHYRNALGTIQKTFDIQSVDVFQDLIRGLSVATIAEQRNLETDAVYKIKYRTRDRIKQLVQEQIKNEETPSHVNWQLSTTP